MYFSHMHSLWRKQPQTACYRKKNKIHKGHGKGTAGRQIYIKMETGIFRMHYYRSVARHSDYYNCQIYCKKKDRMKKQEQIYGKDT